MNVRLFQLLFSLFTIYIAFRSLNRATLRLTYLHTSPKINTVIVVAVTMSWTKCRVEISWKWFTTSSSFNPSQIGIDSTIVVYGMMMNYHCILVIHHHHSDSNSYPTSFSELNYFKFDCLFVVIQKVPRTAFIISLSFKFS